MKCNKCQAENKDGSKFCKRCGADLTPEPIWHPTWKWHINVLAVIYGILIISFFLFNILLKPYMRQIPKEITPWLDKVPKEAVG